MNEYQKALSNIKTEPKEKDYYGDEIPFFKDDDEDIALLQELVDKATPKPLIEKWAWHCQTCGQGFVNHGGNKDNYCSNCGQRLTEEK